MATPRDRAKAAVRAQAKVAARAGFDAYDAAWRRRNRRAPRLLVYSDSRGDNLLARGGFARKYGGTYVHALQRRYAVTRRVNALSHTTIVDFLNYAEGVRLDSFDAVVLHCGVVDFSPRPLSNIEKVKAGKQGVPGFAELFAANAAYHAEPWPIEYHGEPTITLYSPEYLEAAILPRLSAIPHLIWISSNAFVPGWDGNYMRGRPANIDAVVTRFDATMGAALRTVDLRQWTHDDIRALTIDNIHFNRSGFQRVHELIEAQLRDVLAM